MNLPAWDTQEGTEGTWTSLNQPLNTAYVIINNITLFNFNWTFLSFHYVKDLNTFSITVDAAYI